MYLLDITLTLMNKHQLRGYISNPGGDCLRLCTSYDHPTITQPPISTKGKPKNDTDNSARTLEGAIEAYRTSLSS